ncbi:MAG: hypothetical protein JNL69_06945 [Bacteroidia bacterium]|nr:hypothetical protein [Bacteroidia bacterium]
MLFKKVITFILLLICSAAFSQKSMSLLVAEYDENAASNHLQHLVKYTFLNGMMTGKETIVSVPSKKEGKTDYVRFDIGKCKLINNQFLITGIGNVIDVKAKKIVVSERAEFVKYSGDSIVFYTNDIFKGKFYSVLNTKTGKYQKVENANYNPLPRPDVEADETTKPFSITAYYINGKKDELVKDAGYGEAQPLLGDDVKRKFQLFWIDNKSFLYANFSKNQQNASIYKVSLDKSIEKIADITEIPATAANAFFEYAADGTIVYSCGKGKFSIDLVKKKADKLMLEAAGNNFLIEAEENVKYGRAIKFEGVEIGKKWCHTSNAKSINGHIALQNDIVIGSERYPQGVIVWNNITKKWITIEVASFEEIIGWIEE